MAIIQKQIDSEIYKVTLDEEDIFFDKSIPNKFKISFNRWNNENSLYINYDKIKDSDFYFESPDDENIKFGLMLQKKPDINIFHFQLEGWEDFKFWYQKPLANVNPDGSTWENFEWGGIERPAEVSGSYAVYHKTKRDHIIGQTNYATGKFCHIYRPKFIDATGAWVWGNLHIENGIYTITIPQDFLDSAVYPIKANDTIGKTSTGTSRAFMITNYLYCTRTEAASGSGTLTNAHIYGSRRASSNANFTIGLYNETTPYNPNPPNTGPGSLVDNAVEGLVSSDSAQWWDVAAGGGSITTSNVYYAGVWVSNSVNFYSDSTTDNSGYRDKGTYSSTMPASNPLSGGWMDADELWSVYYDFTAAGAGWVSGGKVKNIV